MHSPGTAQAGAFGSSLLTQWDTNEYRLTNIRARHDIAWCPGFDEFDTDPFAATAGENVPIGTEAGGFSDLQSGGGDEFADFGETDWEADLKGFGTRPDADTGCG